MGIIPAVAQGAAASFAADVLTAPLPVAVATVLAVLSVIGLRRLGDRLGGAARPDDGRRGPLRRRLREQSPRLAVEAALLPRLPRRSPHTRTPRPATLPDAAAFGLLRGPPGRDSSSVQRSDGGALPPR